MTLEIQEVYLLQKALEAATIKAIDAPVVATTMAKLQKEYERLEAKQPKKEEAKA
jgi:uncharacterized small protein (DUF1192 family)